jgi:hypothetical protein
VLKVFENRVLKRIFGPRKDEIIRVWKNLHKKELNHFKPNGYYMYHMI